MQVFMQEDYPDFVDELNNAMTRIDLEPVSQEELWELLRVSEDIPDYADIYCETVFYRIYSKLKEFGVNCDYYVNCMNSSFSIDDVEVTTMQEMMDAIGKVRND